MTEAEAGDRDRPWHQALIYAVTGLRRDDVPDQPAPDPELLAEQLRSELPGDALSHRAQVRRSTGQVWPYPVPADLMAGLGYAQFAAALAQLIQLLGLESKRPTATTAEGVTAPTTSPPSAEVRRLLDEVPPHHGS